MLQMKHGNNTLARMAESPLFRDIPEEELRNLSAELNVRIRSYAPKETVSHEGDAATDVYSVLTGRIAVYGPGNGLERRHLVGHLRPGDAYGTFFPALGIRKNPGMLVARAASDVLLCSAAGLRRVLVRGDAPALARNLYRAAAREGSAAWRKMELLSLYEIADRLAMHLRMRGSDGRGEAEIESASELAEYLCVNRTALYRAMGRCGKRDGRAVARETEFPFRNW